MSEHQQERQRVEDMRARNIRYFNNYDPADRPLSTDVNFLLIQHSELVKLLEEAREALKNCLCTCDNPDDYNTCLKERVLTAINNKIGEIK